MGFILSKFRRKKPSTKDQLESIDKELRNIQRFQVDTELQQKKIIGRLIIVSSVAYLIAAAGFYFLAPRGLPWLEQLKFVLPFVIFPFLIWGLKRFVGWYYNQRIVKKKERYAELKKDKQRILEDVMDTETFKVGKEILEKYAPSQLIPKHLAEQFSQLQSMATTMSPMPATPQQQRQMQMRTPTQTGFNEGLRRRQQQQGRPSLTGAMSTPVRPPQPGYSMNHNVQGQFGPSQYYRQATNRINRPILALTGSTQPFSPQSVRFRPSVPQTPAPSYMLPLPPANPVVQNRSLGWMDKLVEYVVGDGPNSRFALICRYCATHNGLATQEEYPYLGFRCAYCKQFNPPKQVRPAAPKLPTNTVLIEELESTLKSDKSETSQVVVTHETDSESDGKDKESPPIKRLMEAVGSETGSDTDTKVAQPEELQSEAKGDQSSSTSEDDEARTNVTEVDDEAKQQEIVESMEVDEEGESTHSKADIISSNEAVQQESEGVSDEIGADEAACQNLTNVQE